MVKGKWKKATCLVLCTAMFLTGKSFDMPEALGTMEVLAEETNLLENATFSENADNWYVTTASGATMEWQNDKQGHGLDGYVKVIGRTDTWNSLAQSIETKVVSGTKYNFSCWVKLSDEYDEESTVKVGLSIKATGDNGGDYTYDGWNLSNNTVTASKDEWRQINGSFTANWSGTLEDLQFKVADETSNKSFYVDDVELIADEADRSIETDIPSLKDYFITKSSNYDFKVGSEMTADLLADENKMALVEKHYNSLTAGNEMKPENIFKGVNEDGSLNLDFSVPDKTLQTFADYNEGKTEADQIHIRGHVLCWHSQTPESFFEDKDGNILDKEEMNARLEEYIKQVVQHVQNTYPGLVYCWDVVNEAINPSDGEVGGLRTENGNVETYYHKIYGSSNEYIINAFQYANKYVDASVKLFYNDYGETDATKMACICSLVDEIKAKSGDPGVGTRIDGIGMQAHYSMESPSANELYTAIMTYAQHVDEVQITELDMAASKSYDGSDTQKEVEQNKQAYRYKEIFDTILKAKDNGANITAVVFWGVSDDDSWLLMDQFADGRHNMPLLFDENLKAKPAYWGIVDPSKLSPNINEESVLNNEDKDWSLASSITIGTDSNSSMKLLWQDGKLFAQVTVKDATVDADDFVTFYLDKDNTKADDATGIETVKVARSEATATAEGYVAETELDITGKSSNDKIGFDVVVDDATAQTSQCWNDLQMKQAERSKYYGTLTLKPFMLIQKGSAIIDGNVDDIWNYVNEQDLTVKSNADSTTNAIVKTMWDENYLYVYADIKDNCLNKENTNVWEQDSLEIFVDEDNGKTETYSADDCQYRINYANELSFNGTNCKDENIESATKTTSTGYLIEAKIKLNTVTGMVGNLIGIDFQINDADASASRVATMNWYDETGMGYAKPSIFGTAKLVSAVAIPPVDKTDISMATVSGIKNCTYTGKKITQNLSVNVGEKRLIENTDYKVAYKNNKNVGTATITIEGYGDYQGTITKTFKIKKANQKIKVKTSSYTKVYGEKKFKLSGISGIGKLSYVSSKNSVAKVDKKGYITIKDYGKATITVTAAGNSNYSKATKKIKVEVIPAKLSLTVTSKKSKEIKASWKANKTMTGYQIQYSKSKNFESSKTVSVKSAKSSYTTIKKLKSKKTYYVRVRSYKKISGGKVYGKWSSIKKVKTK